MAASTEPQLALRSARAAKIARRVNARTGKPIVRIVEEALEAYEARLAAQEAKPGLERAMALAHAELAQGAVVPGKGSDMSDLFDDQGMPL
jgi:hypothetical protein